MTYASPVLLVLGMAAAGAALGYHHRSRGHDTRYLVAGVLTAVIPFWGPLLGLCLKPPVELTPEAARGLSYRSWGTFLLFPAFLTAIVPAMLGPTMGLAFLCASVLSYAAWAVARSGRGGLALALFVSSFGACGGLAYRSLQHSDLVLLSEAGATKGNLGALRHLLSEATAADKGDPPARLESVVGPGKMLTSLPQAKVRPHHPNSSAVEDDGILTDAGGWVYDAVSKTVRVNCTHTDSKGSVWSSY
jgi:hypothetical protein